MNNDTTQSKSITQKVSCKNTDEKNAPQVFSKIIKTKCRLKRVVTVGKNTLLHYIQRCMCHLHVFMLMLEDVKEKVIVFAFHD